MLVELRVCLSSNFKRSRLRRANGWILASGKSTNPQSFWTLPSWQTGLNIYALLGFDETLMQGKAIERAPHLDLEAEPLWTKEAPSRGNADGVVASFDLAAGPTASESGVSGGVSDDRCVSGPSSCHWARTLERKAAVEEAVLLCVAVKEVASMPLSAELSCR